MTKEIVPEFNDVYNSKKTAYSGITKEKYIDKGNLTSRECGRLVKGMVEEYENKFIY